MAQRGATPTRLVGSSAVMSAGIEVQLDPGSGLLVVSCGTDVFSWRSNIGISLPRSGQYALAFGGLYALGTPPPAAGSAVGKLVRFHQSACYPD